MDLHAQVMAEIQRIIGEVGTKHENLRKHVDDSIDKISTAMRRSLSSACTSGDLPVIKSAEDLAFGVFLRKGVEALEPTQRKALTVGNDPSAGYLAPSYFSARVEQFIREISQLVSRARMFEFSQGEMDLPKVTSGTSATWVGETELRPETTLAIGLNTLTLHELACYVDVSNRLLDDAAVNIEELLAEDLAGAFASAMNAAILVGNGVKRPLGLMSGAVPGVVRVPTGDVATILPDSLSTAVEFQAAVAE